MSRKEAKAAQHLQDALAIHGAGRLAEALAIYQRAIGASPNLAPAHEARGIALAQLGRRDEALKSLNRAAGLDRRNANILTNRGTVLNELGRPAEALADFERALDILPDSPAAHYGLGNALLELKRHEEALERFDRALELQPRFAQALGGRGQALSALGRHEEVLESYNLALELDPASADTWYNRGNCLRHLRRLRDAGKDFYKALSLDSDKVRYHLEAASVCNEIGMLDEALIRANDALKLKAADLEGHIQRGRILQGLQRYAEAVDDFDFVLEIQPEDAATVCFRDLSLRSIHLWRDNGLDASALHRLLETAPSVPPPFLVLSMSSNGAFQKMVAVRHANGFERAAQPPPRPYPRRDKIRLGYFSADFHNHATMYLMAEMLERRDRERFEVTAFSFGPDDKSDWRARAEAAVDRFIDLREKTDDEIAAISRELEIDIAVDLKGFTLHARPFVFAKRAAPVQVNYLGYPGTMGCSFYDYIIADPVVIPPSHRDFYTEKVVCLPDSYQPNCRAAAIDSRPIARADVGLPEHGVVFCSFNQSYKVTAEMFDVWMNILARVDGSVLWMWVKSDEASANLREEARKRGIDPGRLHFADTLPLSEHLARLPLADIFLDSRHYNAHTTASDALRMGVPVITCPDQAFASRVAASLVTAARLPELIASTLADYAELAVALGRDRERLNAMKKKLTAEAQSSPLFDSERYARHVEAAYEAMYERLMADLPPDHIDVPALA